MFIDRTYFLVLLGALLCMAASANVKATFRKYSRVAASSGMTGAEAAQRILHQCGAFDVMVEHVSGELTDHYDPSAKVLRLSDATYGSRSVAAIGVAAHECGHVMQHLEGYAFLSFRTALVPAANIGSQMGLPLVIIGLMLEGFMRSGFIGLTLARIGIVLFFFAVLFQLVTLPVEFDASNRALRMLTQYGILTDAEEPQSREVLRAAAMTYVAALSASVMQLLRLIMIANSGRRRR